MVSSLLTLLMILLLFLSGKIFESIKRLFTLLIDIGLKLLNLFGIHINRHEKRYRVSKKFKQIYQDITIVRKSKQNEKIKKSINIPAAIIFGVCLIILLLNVIEPTRGCISNWLWEINPVPQLIDDPSKMDITFTAVLFSFMSFAVSKLISQWKETKDYRKAKRNIKLKNKVFRISNSKELLDEAKLKDKIGYEEIVYSEEDK